MLRHQPGGLAAAQGVVEGLGHAPEVAPSHTIEHLLVRKIDALARGVLGERTAKPAPMTEAEFRWELNQDAMAVEKLGEGIRLFAIDQGKLETMLASHL